MTHTIKKLRELSDEQLIKEHDAKAVNTTVGTQFYIEELDRRSRERSERKIFWLSVLSTIASIAAVATSIIALTKING